MDVLIAILLAGGIVSIGAHLMRRRREALARERDSIKESVVGDATDGAGPALEQLEVGDLVIHGRADMLVEDVVALSEGATSWIECALRDGARRYALVVHPADPTHALVGEPVDDLVTGAGEPPESIDHRGRIFRLQRCGQAHSTGHGGDRVVCDHWLYDRPGEARIWLRRSGRGELRCFVGERVARHLLDALPGSDRAEREPGR